LAINWQKKEKQVEPYSKLAFIYDDVMLHVNYETWAKYIGRIIKKYNPEAKTIIDIACGTGSFLLELSPNYPFVYGMDYSYNMIRNAHEKFYLYGYAIPIWQGNIREFYLKKTVDVVLCLYDSINYLTTLEDVNQFLHCAYENLSNPGLFIFDICTEKNSIKYFNNYFEKNKKQEYHYTRKSSYNIKTRIHKNIFKIQFKNSAVNFLEEHQQKIYYVNEMIDLIANSPFTLIDVLDGFSFKQGSENSLRVHFVLKKE